MLLNYDIKHPTVTSGVTQPLRSAAPSNISEPTSMEQKSVLITGCSSGIGKCLARGLKQRGYRVFATARQVVDVESLTQAGFESLPLDLDSSISIRVAVETVLADRKS